MNYLKLKKPVCIQIEITPYGYNNNLIDYCKTNNIEIMAHSITHCGEIFNDVELMNMSNDKNVTIIELIISWLLFLNIKMTIGSSDFDHIKNNNKIRIIEDSEINDFDVERINKLNVNKYLWA